MIVCNKNEKALIAKSGLTQRAIASKMGMPEWKFWRMMKFPMEKDQSDALKDAIKALTEK